MHIFLIFSYFWCMSTCKAPVIKALPSPYVSLIKALLSVCQAGNIVSLNVSPLVRARTPLPLAYLTSFDADWLLRATLYPSWKERAHSPEVRADSIIHNRFDFYVSNRFHILSILLCMVFFGHPQQLNPIILRMVPASSSSSLIIFWLLK